MEYIISNTKWEDGNIKHSHDERFEGTPQEIAALLKLTNGMGEVGNIDSINFPHISSSEEIIKAISDLPRIVKEKNEVKDDNIFTTKDIEDFKNGRVAIHCPTKELANELLRKLYNLGFLWYGGDYEDARWRHYNEVTCYCCVEGKYLNFGKIMFHKEKGHKIKEFKSW